MRDRDAKWSTSTCLMMMFMGFFIGFIACHELYTGMDKRHQPIMEEMNE